ncbi:IS110 family transposase [Rhodococcus jostii]|uniref:IS110 family transposase n=1 Tax=Rhodococcus jostii TaxID=132919 RepID=UPI00362F3A0F
MSVPGWGPTHIGNYAGALGDPERWAGPAQIYRVSGLVPAQYESAGKRRDGHISREGSVPLRRALIELGFGLRHNEPAAKRYVADLNRWTSLLEARVVVEDFKDDHNHRHGARR